MLSPDCISSTAYGTEEMLTILVPAAGVAAFSLVMPVTIAIIVVLFFVTLSYREVVMAYTKAGGSYVVARDNFGLPVAQIAAVALLIDYTVTVAVQSAAGTNALTSAVPSLSAYQVPITIAVVVLLVFANLRGMREAGRAFAIPTYLFIFTIAAVIIVGIVQGRHQRAAPRATKAGALGPEPRHIGHTGRGHRRCCSGVSVFLLLKAFANGGSSLTGLEAISNGVGAFQPPEGPNARRVLVIMAVSPRLPGPRRVRAGPHHPRHPVRQRHARRCCPRRPRSSSARQRAARPSTTSCSRHPADPLHRGQHQLQRLPLPGQLRGRGPVPALQADQAGAPPGVLQRHPACWRSSPSPCCSSPRAKVDALVAVYAIGVFTGFTMAGAGHGQAPPHPPRSGRGGARSGSTASPRSCRFAVVIIFAVTKFTEGAWVVVVLFPLMWFGLLRLNRRYREEASVLGETAAEAAAEAKPLPPPRRPDPRRPPGPGHRPGHPVRPDPQRRRAAGRALRHRRREGQAAGRIAGCASVCPACPSSWSSARIAGWCGRAWRWPTGGWPTARPRSTSCSPAGPTSGRGAGSSTTPTASASPPRSAALPHVNATIVPFDVDEELADRRRATSHEHSHLAVPDEETEVDDEEARIDEEYFDPVPGCSAIGSLHNRERARVAGRIRSVTVQPWGSVPTLECDLTDDHESMTVAFLGRRQIAGIEPGSRIVVDGTVGMRRGRLMMINPDYELLPPPDA